MNVNHNNTDYISVPLDIANELTPKFLVDSQADISLIKHGALNNDVPINTFNTILIKGVTDGQIESLGVIKALINLNNQNIPQIFHVVDDSFPIPTAGILGKDFFKNYSCQLDYANNSLLIRINNREIQVPIIEASNSLIDVPARCEIVTKIPLKNQKQSTVILAQEIAPGVYTANTITDSKNAYARIINTNDEPTKIKAGTPSKQHP